VSDLTEDEIWGWEWLTIIQEELHEYFGSSGMRYIRVTTNALAAVIAIKPGSEKSEVILGRGLKYDARVAVARHEQSLTRMVSS
jgi:hypothetical protein